MKNKYSLIRLLLFVGLVISIASVNPAQTSTAKFSKKKLKKYSKSNSTINDEWYLRSDDKKVFLFIREIGKGEPVIVLHGGPGAGHRYIMDISNKLEDQFRFIFYDQRGAGFTYASKDEISMEKNVQDLETLRKALGLEKINLISHSAGTMLAMNYLEKHPKNVKNLVMLGALDPINGKPEAFSSEELELFKKNGAERNYFSIKRPEIQSEIKKAGLDKPNLTPKERYQIRRIKSAAGNIYHLDRWRKALFFILSSEAANATQTSTNFVYDWTELLAEHPHPITVINGEYDYIVGPKGSPIWKRVTETTVKNVKLVVLKKAGHSSWIDDPNGFRKTLRAALTRK